MTSFWTDLKRFAVLGWLGCFGLGVVVGIFIAENVVALYAVIALTVVLGARTRFRARA